MSCESCQQQLFPFLYDLVEPAEHEAIETHLRDCPRCQAELKLTRARWADLAAAVKGSFPDVVFTPPRVVARPPQLVAAARRAPRRPLLLGRWAAAAAILVVVLLGGSVLAWNLYHLQGAQAGHAIEQLADAQARLQAIQTEVHAKQVHYQKDVQAIQEQIDRLIGDWNQKQTQQRDVLKHERIHFEIKGPKSVQAGAPNRYEIDVKPADPQRPVQVGQVRAQVVNDKTKAVLFTKEFAGAAHNQLVLPQDLAIRPGDELSLVLEADADGVPAQVREHLSLLFPEYVTHLSTDRPMYRPGEVVRFRSLTLERFSLRPAADDLHLRYRVVGPNNHELFKYDVAPRLVTAKGKPPIAGPDGQPLHGIGAGEFALARDLPGGVYTLSVTDLNDRFPEEKRSFIVHRWQAPRFNKEAEFTRASYGPGERVLLRGTVTRIGAPAGNVVAPQGFGMPGMAPNPIVVHATATVDGRHLQSEERNVDPDGRFTFEFALVPGFLTNGDGTVTLEFRDGGNVETLVRTIPIVLRDISVDFYPEGGDLVPGVANRVYFQARTGTSKPADVQGRIIEHSPLRQENGRPVPAAGVREVARVQTLTDAKEPGLNEGLGVFTFVPQPGRRYWLQLDRPVGIAKTYPLPEAKGEVLLHLPAGVVEKTIPVTVRSANKDRELLVGAYCRGKLLDHRTVQVRAGQQADLVLHPAADVGGVYRVTVFDKQSNAGTARYVPVAERLLFRKQTGQVHVAIHADRAAYAPGEAVALGLDARNEKKERISAIAMVAVVDASVLKLAGDKAARSMPTHFLLTTEIRRPQDLEDSDALLGDHPRAAEALDLLLGAQGWRRFAEQDPQKLARKPVLGRPAGFLANTQPVSKVGAAEQESRDQLDQPFVGKFVNLEESLAEKEREEADSPDLQQQLATAQTMVHQANEHASEELRRKDDLVRLFVQAGIGVAGICFVCFAFFLVSSGLHRLAEGHRGYVVLGIGLAVLAVLFVTSVVGTFVLMALPNDQVRLFGGHRPQFAPPAMAKAMPERGVGRPMAGMPMAPMPGVVPQAAVAEEEIRDEAQAADDVPNRNLPGMLAAAPLPFDANDPERALRQQGRYQELLQRKLGRRVTVPPPADPCVVREYAHHHKTTPGQARRDFTETLCWQPALVLEDGKAQLHFDLSDAVTHFRVLVVSHTLDGRLGTDTVEIATRLPYSVEPKVPVEVAASDRLILPIAVRNDTNAQATATLQVRAPGLTLLDAPAPLAVEAGQTRRRLLRFQSPLTEGKVVARFQAAFDKGTDVVERSFTVVPDGFPDGGSISGTLQGLAPATHEIVMPERRIPGSLKLEVHAYPSILADLQQGAAALLREPHGCFEQASSSNYPNVLMLRYLQDTKQANPAIEKHARTLLANGYPHLLAFECADAADPKVRHGFEWFGRTAPPHEALTAYGLLEFHDMARVFPVDAALIERTRKYLLDQRDGKGGFKRNARAVDQFGRAPQNITNAYIAWALTETGTKDELAPELDALFAQSQASNDPYFLALVSLGQLNVGRADRGLELLRRLRGFQQDTGAVAGAPTSITSSAGRDLLIETTSLAALGWLRGARPEFHAEAQKAGRWLVQQRSGAGGFGATQATVLALKALIHYAAVNPRGMQPGELNLEVVHDNGMNVNGKAILASGTFDPIVVALHEQAGDGPNPPATVLASGKNHVHVRLAGGNNQLPYTLSWSYRTLKPAVAAACPVQLTTALDQAKAQEGKSVKLKVTLENKSGRDQGMAVAIVGLPAGLTLPKDFRQLKELTRPRDNDTRPGVISAWELHGRELVLYWRELKADARVAVDLDLVCDLPGVYSGPASRAYLYYDADAKHWIEPLRVSIDPAP